jgi:chromosome partitioning protein
MRSLAVMGEKGGTAKSTTVINVAAALAKRGHKVLAIDADSQASITMVLLMGRGPSPPTLADVLLERADAMDAIRPTGSRRLSLLPADGNLADVNVALAAEVGRERRLRLAMEGVADDYDFVIVDTGPARSLVNVNVMNFAGEILAPIEPGIFALAGLGKVQDAIGEVAKYLDNRTLRLSGLLLTRCRNDNVSRDAERQLRETFGRLVYGTTVPASVKVEEANARFLPVIDYAPRSPAATAYQSLTEEIIHGQRAQDRAGQRADEPVAADDAA